MAKEVEWASLEGGGLLSGSYGLRVFEHIGYRKWKEFLLP
jgi:hypothetical protein